MMESKKADAQTEPEQNEVVIIHPQSTPDKNATRQVAATDFILQDVIETEVVPAEDFLREVKRIGWTGFAGYDKQHEMSFSIARQSPADVHDGNNLTRYANCIRRYINARNEVLVLDFIPNHEQKSSIPVVQETGEACLINEIRIAMNGVLVRQVRGNIYELHAVNCIAGQQHMDVTTSHITRRGDKPGDPWHGDFAPGIKLGCIEPGSELHISTIYMKAGRVFTNELYVVEGSEVIMPSDKTCFLHNGFTKYEQPDMIDASGKQLRDPMVNAPRVIKLGMYPQPYANPRELVRRALMQLTSDLAEIMAHAQKAAAALTSPDNTIYAFDNVSVSINDKSNELISRIYGFDISIGKVIATNARFLEPVKCTYNNAHLDHQTKKEVIIRITSPNALDLYKRSIDLAIVRTDSLIRQLDATA